MQEFIQARIKSLPPLSDTAVKIQQICTDPDGSLAELSAIVQSDPMLTANILRSANSPLYGFSREITTVERAVNLFGMVTVRGFALNAAMKMSFKIDLSAYGINERQFLDLCTRQNALATRWLQRADMRLKSICIPASFLLEIGKLIVSSVMSEQGKTTEFKERAKACENLTKLCELEREFIGSSSYEITAQVFDKWALDTDMVHAIAQIGEPKDSQQACVLRVILEACNILSPMPSDDDKARAISLCEEYELDTKLAAEAIGYMQNA